LFDICTYDHIIKIRIKSGGPKTMTKLTLSVDEEIVKIAKDLAEIEDLLFPKWLPLSS
jgi:hypothetical protein